MIKLNTKLRSLFRTHGEPVATPARMPLFITGCMRSGTSFLVAKVTAHPQLLKIGSELNDAWTDIGGASIRDNCVYCGADDASGDHAFQMSKYFFDFVQKSRTLRRHFMRANDVFAGQPGRIGYDWDNVIPVNKSPHLMNKISYVNGLFPSSKIIVIVRNIYGHTSSMKVHFDNHYKKTSRRFFMPDSSGACWSSAHENNIPAHFADGLMYPPDFGLIPSMWIRLNKLALETVEGMDPDQYMVINYEDLLEAQEPILKKMFAFLELDPKHAHHVEKIATVKNKTFNTTTKGAPLTKWKKNLSDEEVQTIADVIAHEQADYDLVLSKLDKLKVRA